MPKIKANNATFYYELVGKGQPIILIAGYTCDYSTWQLMMEQLSNHFQVLVFDNRGIGQTTDTNEPLSAELMAEDVIALSEQLHLDKPHIVGQSMGGTIAQTIAAKFPDKINKLCLLTTSAKWRHAKNSFSRFTCRSKSMPRKMAGDFPPLRGRPRLKRP